MGKKVGCTGRDHQGEVEGEDDTEEEEIEDERNDIIVREKHKVHKLGGYFTKRRRFLGGKERKDEELRNTSGRLIRGEDERSMTEINFQVPRYFRMKG
jgi:hypothetical protein